MQNCRRLATPLAASLFIAAMIGGATTWAQTPDARVESLAAWEKIALVLQHPRCLNCHQEKSPLQGDSRRVHIPPVEQDASGKVRGTMKCLNCHNEKNNEMAGIPGAEHWKLAPPSMMWQGLSSAAICKKLRDKDNHEWPLDRIVGHLVGDKADPLVLWAWDPGGNRKPIPVSKSEFAALVKQWADDNGPCPR
jgi:hypothetical protein